MTYARTCVQPGFTFFEKMFWSELLTSVNAFKSACLFHKPSARQTMKSLSVFTF